MTTVGTCSPVPSLAYDQGRRSARRGPDVLVRVLPAEDRCRPADARAHDRRARAARRPASSSVTYGAGGSTRERTHEVVKWVRKETADHADGPPHLRRPRAATRSSEILDDYRVGGHREHPRPRRRPAGRRAALPATTATPSSWSSDVRDGGRFCVGVAAHPELHPRSPRPRRPTGATSPTSWRVADFAITQFFFEAEHYLRLVDELGGARRRQAGAPRDHAGHQRQPGAGGWPSCRGAAFPEWLVDRLDGVDDPDDGSPHRRRRGHRAVRASCSRPARRACTSTRSTGPPRPARSTPTSASPACRSSPQWSSRPLGRSNGALPGRP